MTNVLTDVLTRQASARDRFLAFAIETAGLTREQAETAYAALRRARVLKIDVHVGQFSFTHGAFASADVLRRAAGL